MSNIAVTGATGFIGAAVVADITAHGHHVTALTRGANPQPDTVSIQWHSNTDYASPAAMTRAIAGTDYVIHLADDATRNGDHNSEAALAVARALSLAMQANGQKQLIFASSIYARMGTAYGNKKKVVEDFFLKETDVEPIILRLPPVYGPGCGGGFAVLSGLLRRGLPLPFGNATALRAYISLKNLCALIEHIVSLELDTWTAAAGQIYEPSDGSAIATNTLARHIGITLGLPARLFSVPQSLLLLAGGLTGKRNAVEAALSPLETTDNGKLQQILGWHPVEHPPESFGFLTKDTV